MVMIPKPEAPFIFVRPPIDSESERLRECLRILGPALDEEGFALRRYIAASVCIRAMRPFEGENLRVNPEDGDLTDEEKHRMVEAMRHALGGGDFRPVVSFDFRTHRINLDILPREWPGLAASLGIDS